MKRNTIDAGPDAQFTFKQLQARRDRLPMKPNFSQFSGLRNLHFQPTPGQVYSELARELTIHDSKSGICYGLDPVGARIWSLLLDWKTVSEIRAIILEEYDVDTARVEGDIAHLLEELFTKGLIEVASASARPAREPAEKEIVPEFL